MSGLDTPLTAEKLQTHGTPSHRAMEDAADWYALLISDEFSVQDKNQWQAWLAASADHRAAWYYVEQVSHRVLSPLRETPDPRGMVDTLQTVNVRLMHRRRLLAGLAVLVGVGSLAAVRGRLTDLADPLLTYTADYRTATGETHEVALPDGTQVWLNTASAFNQHFTNEVRRLRLLTGEILVNTSAEARRPFIVDTAQGQLRTLGTRFTVWQGQGETFLAVYKGAVEIRRSTGETCIVANGMQTRFTTDNVQPLAAAELARQDWSRGNLVAMNLTLQDVVAQLSRYTHRHIGVAPDVSQRRVLGTFPLHDIDDTLGLLAAAARVSIRRPLPWWITLEAPSAQG